MSSLRWRGNTGRKMGATFYREAEMTNKRALRHMRRVAKATLKTAIEWAPVDWKGMKPSDPPRHELERSHKIEEIRGESKRIECRITAGGRVGGVNVDRYAMWVHNLEPHQRGRATIAKGPKAGPGWMARALEEHENDFEPLLDELMEGLLG